MKKQSQKREWLYRKKWLSVGNFTGINCETCHEPTLYYYDYDATCCPRCDEWSEKRCDDPMCGFCSRRPATPLMAITLERPHSDYRFYIRKYQSRRKRSEHRDRIAMIRKQKQEKQ